MPWTKGKSGNPNGRPRKGSCYADMLEKAVKNLRSVQKDKDGNITAQYRGKMVLAMATVDLATNKAYPPQIRLQALREIVDRTEGKAPQCLDMMAQVGLAEGQEPIVMNFIDKEGGNFGQDKNEHQP